MTDKRAAELLAKKLTAIYGYTFYSKPMTAKELSAELGVAMPYLEEEIDSLEAIGVIKKTGEKYHTNLIIITDEYETAFVKNTSEIYSSLATSVWEKVNALM